jgi:hypothetical protein
MKVSRKSGFEPVIITLETAEELKLLNTILHKRNDSVRSRDPVFPEWNCEKLFSCDQVLLMSKMYAELPSR